MLEVAALVALVPWTMTSIDASGFDLTIIALHLTALGAVLVAHSLIHADRRPVAWPGGALRCTPWRPGVAVADPRASGSKSECARPPTASSLAGLGLWHLRRHPGAL